MHGICSTATSLFGHISYGICLCTRILLYYRSALFSPTPNTCTIYLILNHSTSPHSMLILSFTYILGAEVTICAGFLPSTSPPSPLFAITHRALSTKMHQVFPAPGLGLGPGQGQGQGPGQGRGEGTGSRQVGSLLRTGKGSRQENGSENGSGKGSRKNPGNEPLRKTSTILTQRVSTKINQFMQTMLFGRDYGNGSGSGSRGTGMNGSKQGSSGNGLMNIKNASSKNTAGRKNNGSGKNGNGSGKNGNGSGKNGNGSGSGGDAVVSGELIISVHDKGAGITSQRRTLSTSYQRPIISHLIESVY